MHLGDHYEKITLDTRAKCVEIKNLTICTYFVMQFQRVWIDELLVTMISVGGLGAYIFNYLKILNLFIYSPKNVF